MANVYFTTGAESSMSNTGTINPARKAGQIIFTIDSNNHGAIWYDKDASTRVKMTYSADIAEKANKDNLGNVIHTTYFSEVEGTTAADKYTLSFNNPNDTLVQSIDIPSATNQAAGLISTGLQNIAGAKTFDTSISTPTLTVTGAGGLLYSGIQTGTTDVARVIWFADATHKGKPVQNDNFTYNPYSSTLFVKNIALTNKMSTSDNTNSSYSGDNAASIITPGGVSVEKRLSAGSVRVDNNSSTKGAELQFDITNECLKFVFS